MTFHSVFADLGAGRKWPLATAMRQIPKSKPSVYFTLFTKLDMHTRVVNTH